MDVQAWKAAVEEYIFTIEDIIKELYQIRSKSRRWHIGCISGKTAGVTAGAAGTIISIIGLVGAPLTGGMSLIATAIGMSTGLTGAATSTASEITDSISNR